MEKIKRLLNKGSAESTIFSVIEAKPCEQKYAQAVQQFSSLPEDKKAEIISNIEKSFRKQRQPKTIIATLLLIDYLYPFVPDYSLRNASEPKMVNKSKNTTLNNKIFLAEEQFAKTYFQVLKKCGVKMSSDIDFKSCEFTEWLEYCELSVEMIWDILKIDFVLSFLIKSSSNDHLIRLSCQSILAKIGYDLKVLNNFLECNLSKVLKKCEHSFRINALHEKLLSINQKLPYLRNISKNLLRPIYFEEYCYDRKLDKSVQMELFDREDERQEYIRSQKTINLSKVEEKQEGNNIEEDTMVRLNDDFI